MDGKIGGSRNQAQSINQSNCCADMLVGIIFFNKIIILVYLCFVLFDGPDHSS